MEVLLSRGVPHMNPNTKSLHGGFWCCSNVDSIRVEMIQAGTNRMIIVRVLYILYTHSTLSICIYTVYKLYKCHTVILEVTDAIN